MIAAAIPEWVSSMWGVTDKAVFARMLDTDVRWLFRLLSQCRRGRPCYRWNGQQRWRTCLHSSAGPHSPQRFDSIRWAFATDDAHGILVSVMAYTFSGGHGLNIHALVPETNRVDLLALFEKGRQP